MPEQEHVRRASEHRRHRARRRHSPPQQLRFAFACGCWSTWPPCFRLGRCFCSCGGRTAACCTRKSPFIITITTSRVKWHDTVTWERLTNTWKVCVCFWLFFFLFFLNHYSYSVKKNHAKRMRFYIFTYYSRVKNVQRREMMGFSDTSRVHELAKGTRFTYDKHFTYDTQNATCEKHRNAWNDVAFQTLKHMTYDFR